MPSIFCKYINSERIEERIGFSMTCAFQLVCLQRKKKIKTFLPEDSRRCAASFYEFFVVVFLTIWVTERGGNRENLGAIYGFFFFHFRFCCYTSKMSSNRPPPNTNIRAFRRRRRVYSKRSRPENHFAWPVHLLRRDRRRGFLNFAGN